MGGATGSQTAAQSFHPGAHASLGMGVSSGPNMGGLPPPPNSNTQN